MQHRRSAILSPNSKSFLQMYIILLVIITLLNFYLQRINNGSSQPVYTEVEKKYLPIYRVVVLADILQLSFLIKQYEKSNFYSQPDVSVLVVTGLGFSAFAALFIQILINRFGVKRVSISSCIVYSLASFLCLVNDIYISWLARAISGVASTLLISSLEIIAHAANDLQGIYQQKHSHFLFLDGSALSLAEMFAKSARWEELWIVAVGIYI